MKGSIRSFFIVILINIYSENTFASNCLVRSLETYSKISRVQLTIIKEENLPSLGVKNKATIRLDMLKGKSMKLSFLDKGHTGYKNNNMKLNYYFDNYINIVHGETKGIINYLSHVATFLLPKKIHLYSKHAVKNELFTVNRSGIDFIFTSLRVLKKSPFLSVIELDDRCYVRYRPNKEITITKKKFKSVVNIENLTGFPAFYIYLFNRDKYPSFEKFLIGIANESINIPDKFFTSEIVINKKNNLPSEFVIFKDINKIASYQFKDIVVN